MKTKRDGKTAAMRLASPMPALPVGRAGPSMYQPLPGSSDSPKERTGTRRAAWSIPLPAVQDPGRPEPGREPLAGPWDTRAKGRQRGADTSLSPHHTSDSRLETRRQDPPAQGLATPRATSKSLLSAPTARRKASSPRLPQSLQALSQRPDPRSQGCTPGCSRGGGDPRERCPA